MGRKFACANCVVNALDERLQFFVEMGCRASDHGLDYIPYVDTNAEKATAAFKKAMAGETLTQEEGDEYTTYVLLALGRPVQEVQRGSCSCTTAACATSTRRCTASSAPIPATI